MQTVEAFMSVSAVPTVQLVHDVFPTALYEPLEHAAHAVAGLLSVSALPEVHGVQEMEPTAE